MVTRRAKQSAAVVLLAIAIAWGAVTAWASLRPDLLIVGGLIVNGTGDQPFVGNLAISAGRIAWVGRWPRWLTAPVRTISAESLVVAPGFIDVHVHVEGNVPRRGSFKPLNFLRQGVTTMISGNCGRSASDIGDWLDGLDRHGTMANIATLVGHNTIRQRVMGTDARAASAAESQRMNQLAAAELRGGALGVSFGLAYVPGRFAEVDELVAIAHETAKQGAIVAWHIRDEGHGGSAGIKEALDVARSTGVRTHFSHLKASTPIAWGTMAAHLSAIDEATRQGLQVSFDAYPYDRSSTTTDVLLPDWAVGGAGEGLKKASRDPGTRRRLASDLLERLRLAGWTGLSFVRLTSGRPAWIGRSIAEITGDSTRPYQTATLADEVDSLIEISMRGGAQAVFADMSQPDVDLAVTNRASVFGSDSAVRDPMVEARPHPRGLGTFPRVFSKYVRQEHQLTLAAAVRKSSAQAAELFGIRDRGVIRRGNWADLVVFDPDRIDDRATYDEPLLPPSGVAAVLVNGSIVVQQGNITDAVPAGQVIRRTARPIGME